jgi:hypothetical protein
MPAVYLVGNRAILLVLLFLTLRAGALDLPVTTIESLSSPPLTFGRFLCVKIAGEAICTKMFFWHPFSVVVAFDMLPGIAFWTVDGIAIIICIDTYAFDGVFLLILKICVRKGAVRQWRG